MHFHVLCIISYLVDKSTLYLIRVRVSRLGFQHSIMNHDTKDKLKLSQNADADAFCVNVHRAHDFDQSIDIYDHLSTNDSPDRVHSHHEGKGRGGGQVHDVLP